jgi:hypothetical protein
MAPQKVNNHTREDLMDSERDDSSAVEVRRTSLKRTYKIPKEYGKKCIVQSP